MKKYSLFIIILAIVLLSSSCRWLIKAEKNEYVKAISTKEEVKNQVLKVFKDNMNKYNKKFIFIDYSLTGILNNSELLVVYPKGSDPERDRVEIRKIEENGKKAYIDNYKD